MIKGQGLKVMENEKRDFSSPASEGMGSSERSYYFMLFFVIYQELTRTGEDDPSLKEV